MLILCLLYLSPVSATGVLPPGAADGSSSVVPAPHMVQPRIGVGGVSPIIGGGSGSAAMVGAPCFRGGPAAANNILDATQRSLEYRGSLVRAARCLLGSVTRVLLLADTVVVKQLLLAKDKVSPPAVAPTVFFFFFFFIIIFFFFFFEGLYF